LRFVRYIKRKFHEHRAKKEEENSADRAARKTATATAWIAAFTVAIAGVGVLQWRALIRTDETTREALVSVQRAFVVVHDFLHENITAPVAGLRITPRWENSGLTPTRELVTDGSWALFKGKMAEDFDFPDLPGVSIRRFVLGPKAVMNGGGVLIPADVINEAKKGNNHLYIWGWADYNDIFKNTPRHRTEFCAEVLIGNGATASNMTATLLVCEQYNGADSETMKKPKPYP
jgi:hypothetical protein